MSTILISRTDSIGDVVLTLPLAGVLKKHLPDCRIIFLGTSYTQPVIEACEHVDQFLDWDDIRTAGDQKSQSAGISNLGADVILHVFPVKAICKLAFHARIPLRISTSHRWYTWLYCNNRVHFSRKKSDLHEAQLNIKLLEPLGINHPVKISDIPELYGLKKNFVSHQDQFCSLLNPDKFNLILHPKSKGSAREWGTDNFSRLIDQLPDKKFRIFITGTESEGSHMRSLLDKHQKKIIDLTGKMALPEFLSFISKCDGMIAASTGPLHVAAAFGKIAIGLYAPMRPIFPQRWAPLGQNAKALVIEKECNKCRHSLSCECIREITPEEVMRTLMECIRN